MHSAPDYASGHDEQPEMDLATTIQQIAGLPRADIDENSGEYHTTPSAVERTVSLLVLAFGQMGTRFPTGSAVGDGYGGVYVYWNRRGRQVQLIVPSIGEEQPSLYRRQIGSSEYTFERGITAKSLAESLDELSQL